jgi:hypothetical protein
VGAERVVLGADVAVRQAVRGLVLDDAGVEVAVGVGALEGVVDRLPQEHAAPRRDAVGQREHAGVVAAGVGRCTARWKNRFVVAGSRSRAYDGGTAAPFVFVHLASES